MFIFCHIASTPLGKIWRNTNHHLDGGVPGRRVEPILKPAHLTDGVVVTHQSVLPAAVRDRVEITVEGKGKRGGEHENARQLFWGPEIDVCSAFIHVHVVVPRRANDRLAVCQHQTGWESLRREPVRKWHVRTGEQRERVEGKLKKTANLGVPCWRRTCSSGTPSALWKTFSASSLEERETLVSLIKLKFIHFSAATAAVSDRDRNLGIPASAIQ